jgi:hypothetical protein
VHLAGRTLLRPAVLTADSPERDAGWHRVAALFRAAQYSWRDPLNARSFQAWRNRLPHRKDTVSVIRAGSPEQAYRVRTETGSSVLRCASLTLRGARLRPSGGRFEFDGQAPLEMEESDAPLAPALPEDARHARRQEEETPAGPADTLHVLAALNQIGADVGDPITVSLDPQHRVLVSATGLSAERREQVAAVLQGLPRVKLDLNSAPPAVPANNHPPLPERESNGMPAPLRKQFEDRLGGPIALQELTDRTLEASASAVAVAHALDLLDSKFPPEIAGTLSDADRQMLHTLRQRHLAALRDHVAQIRHDWKPLLPAAALPGLHQPAAGLLTVVQEIDTALNRLLAGSDGPPAGDPALSMLAQRLASLDQRIEGALR